MAPKTIMSVEECLCKHNTFMRFILWVVKGDVISREEGGKNEIETLRTENMNNLPCSTVWSPVQSGFKLYPR